MIATISDMLKGTCEKCGDSKGAVIYKNALKKFLCKKCYVEVSK